MVEGGIGQLAQIEIDNKLFQVSNDLHALNRRPVWRRVVEKGVQSCEKISVVARESNKLLQEMSHRQTVVGHGNDELRASREVRGRRKRSDKCDRGADRSAGLADGALAWEARKLASIM